MASHRICRLADKGKAGGVISLLKFFMTNFNANGVKMVTSSMTNEQKKSITHRAESVLRRAIVRSKEGEQHGLAKRSFDTGARRA
jgi:hypothetical protein